MQTTALGMIFTNKSKKTCELRFGNHHQTELWALAMIEIIKEISKMKQSVPGLSELAMESFVKIPSANTLALNEERKEEPYEEQKVESAADDIHSSESEIAGFGLTFTVPKICLILKTRKMAITD